MIERITHYTTAEGGKWFDWPSKLSDGVPCKEMLARMQNKKKWNFLQTTQMTREYNGLQIHSFKTSFDRAWDVINGWR